MRRLSYANVTATLALFLAMAGGAYAAKRYLINSTRQISPKVLKQLRGARGPRGETGPLGPIGPQGETGLTGHGGQRGEKGERGVSAVAPLSPGETESGDFEVSAPADSASATVNSVVSLPIPLPPAIEVAKAEYTTTKTESCPGPGSAAKGYLCIYVVSQTNMTGTSAFDPESPSATEGSGRYGFGMTWTVTEPASASRAYGTYSVTAG